MINAGARLKRAPHSLGRLRLRLTAWYVGTLLAILLLLGDGLFGAITRRFDADLDASLRVASNVLADAARTRGVQRASNELVIPDRQLVVLDTSGNSVAAAQSAPWLARFAASAAKNGPRLISHRSHRDAFLRAYAQPFTYDGHTYVAVAIADEIEVEDKYTALIALFGAAALSAVILVAIGGWFIARKSTEPVERTISYMRRFMADAAHELRTPLSVVRNRADIALQRHREPAEYEETLRGIERESTRMGRIVEDLLMLARADAGERPIERQHVFLDDIVLDAVEAARNLVKQKHVRIEVGEFEEAAVIGDPALIRQLVVILLDNAIKFSVESGRVLVRVRAVDGAAVVSIHDNGLGIPQDQLPHVFERFYRGDTARKRSTSAVSEGAGLGLSIAQWIAEEHGASIGIVSNAAHGTEVTVQFPVVAPTPAPPR